MGSGGQSLMMAGLTKTAMLFADNLDFMKIVRFIFKILLIFNY